MTSPSDIGEEEVGVKMIPSGSTFEFDEALLSEGFSLREEVNDSTKAICLVRTGGGGGGGTNCCEPANNPLRGS